jgi:hypothetical protein
MISCCPSSKINELYPLFKEAFPFNPRLQEPDYLSWQFQYTPFCKKSSAELNILINHDSQGIDALLGFLPIKFWHENQLFNGAQTLNWHAFNQNGAGLKLLQELTKSFSNIFFLGLSSISQKICQLYQMPYIDKVPRQIYIVNQSALAKEFGIKQSLKRAPMQASNSSLPQITKRFNEELDYSLMDETGFINGVQRSGDYLNWRYFDIPNHTYHAISHGREFATYRIEEIAGSTKKLIRILEWTFSESFTAGAIKRILSLCDDSILFMDFYCTHKGIRRSLSKHGFMYTDALGITLPHVFRPINYNYPGLQLAIDLPPHRKPRTIDFNSWLFTKGDGDMDRYKL